MRKRIKIGVYSCTVHFLLTEKFDKDVKKLHKKYHIPYDEEPESAEGTVVAGDAANYHLVIYNKYLSTNTIAHEIYHLVRYILSDRGVEDEEAGAWLCGTLMDEALKFFNRCSAKDTSNSKPSSAITTNQSSQ